MGKTPLSREQFFKTTVAVGASLTFIPSLGRAKSMMPVDIGTILWPGSIPMYVAMAAGLTDHNGLTVRRNIVASGATRRAALVSGEIQFADFTFSNVAVAVVKHAPLKIVASTYDYEAYSLFVRMGLKGQVKTIADLKGKNIGFDTPGAGPWAWERIFLASAGLDPDKDVNMIGGIEGASVIVAALAHGRIDAFGLYEPVTSLAIANDTAYPLVRIWEPAEQRKWVGSTALGSGLTVTANTIKEKPELVRRVVAANRDGLKYINSHTPQEIARLLKTSPRTAQQWNPLKTGVLVSMIDHCSASYKVTNTKISRSGYANEIKAYKAGGVIKSDIPFDEVVDTSFAGEKA